MAKLRKIKKAEPTETYTVTVTRDIDLMSIVNTYKTMSPETDIIVQLLVYARENSWSINEWDTEDELMYQLEEHLTENELLGIANMDALKTNIEDIADELNGVAPKGIEYITIEKNGDEYTLEVTPDDIRKIFLDLI